MGSTSEKRTPPATWRVVSTKSQGHTDQDTQELHVSHVDTQALGSVWHATVAIGSWSITEALAAICVGLLAQSHNDEAVVRLMVPSLAQVLLTRSLLKDLSVADMSVSTTAMRFHGSRPSVLVVSLPQGQDSAANNYGGVVQQVLDHDLRPDVDEAVLVGESRLLDMYQDGSPTNAPRKLLKTLGLDHFSDRGDLFRRLLSLCRMAQDELLQLHSSQDTENIPTLMRHDNWSEEKVVCLCGSVLPPILDSFVDLFSDDADVLSNLPRSLKGNATTTKSLKRMQDFDHEALLYTSGQWLLVEPELGLGGPHRSATLLMRAASTTLFLIRLALGSLDGSVVPELADSASGESMEEPATNDRGTSTRAFQIAPDSHTNLPKSEQDGKKHRCRRFDDLYDKKLRAFIDRLSPDEMTALFSSLEPETTE